MLLPLTFQMGLTIDMGLLLLTPNVPSLPFDPQDNAFLSWAQLPRWAYPSFIPGPITGQLGEVGKSGGGGTGQESVIQLGVTKCRCVTGDGVHSKQGQIPGRASDPDSPLPESWQR